LATIVCDVPVTLDLRAAELRDYDRATVIALFQELEFGASMVKRLPATGGGVEVVDLPGAGGEEPGVPPDDHGAGAAATGAPDGPMQLEMFDIPRSEAGRPTALTSMPGAEERAPLGEYRAVLTEDELREVVAALSSAPGFAFDTEGTGLRPFQDDIVGISLAVEPGRAWYI